MNELFHIEVNCQQNYYDGERICGDVFLSKKIKDEGRVILVLSDGMGHGVKANVLGTLTATLALNFTREHKEMERIAEMIMNTLPVCSERQTSYSTFSIVDIEADGRVTILEYDNPQCFIMRGKKPLDAEWACMLLNSKKNTGGRELKTCSFQAQRDDRIVLFTDGVAQAGLGTKQFPTGWGVDAAHEYVKGMIEKTPDISAAKLSFKVITEANKHDAFESKDDTSCCVIYFREPRKMLIATGPPYENEKDSEMAHYVKNFDGKKVICGGTTSELVSRELNLSINSNTELEDKDLPPLSSMEGVDLVTEGILTLGKVHNILRDYNRSFKLGKGPADRIARLMADSDDIEFLVGTRINEAHQDPNLPVELEIRRTVIRRIANLLETKFLKEVKVRFI